MPATFELLGTGLFAMVGGLALRRHLAIKI